jgi:hypothetical protein
MTLYPEVQRKAQAEIDQIVGNSRLPEFSDEVALPYVQAVLKEALRWHPVTPLGLFLCVNIIFESLVTGLLLQRCHTGSQRVTPTKDISFPQARPLYQMHGAYITTIPLHFLNYF